MGPISEKRRVNKKHAHRIYGWMAARAAGSNGQRWRSDHRADHRRWMALPARNRNGANDGPRELHATPKEYRDLIPKEDLR
jgi:hypothetical protein